jgi:hypothetical protein
MSPIGCRAVAGRSSRDHAEEHSADQHGNDGGKGSNGSHGFLLQFGSCRWDAIYAARNACVFPFGCTMFQVECAHWCATAPTQQPSPNVVATIIRSHVLSAWSNQDADRMRRTTVRVPADAHVNGIDDIPRGWPFEGRCERSDRQILIVESPRPVTRPGPSPEPDVGISAVRLFRGCVLRSLAHRLSPDVDDDTRIG